MKHHMLSTVATNAICIRAFDPGNSFPLAPPGQVNRTFVAALIAAARSAADQGAPSINSNQEDLSARNADSAYMLPYWDLTDDLIEGYDAVKAGADKYLPKFANEPQDNYNARLLQTEMTNVYGDVVEMLASKPFEEPITLQQDKDEATGKVIPLPPDIEEFAKDVDGAGNCLSAFGAVTFFNGINSAIDWIYVDYPKVDPTKVRTQQDQKDLNIRPYWSHVLGRNVLEATSKIVNSKEILVRMRILEPGNPNHIRVFERGDDGRVMMGLFQEKLETDGKTKTFIMVDSAEITIGVIPLVPFFTGRRNGRTWRFSKPMLAAADAQRELYQKESGLKFARIMSAYPMLAANGIKPLKGADGKPLQLAVGPNVVLYSEPDATGNVGNWDYVVPPAENLKWLKQDVKEQQDVVRDLGRQPLTAQSGNLTVVTTAYAAGKTRSAVGWWAVALKEALENAMKLTCLWLKLRTTDFTPVINIYDDFDDFTTDQASDQSTLQFARENGDLSHENYIAELKRRNTIRPDMDEEENKRQLLAETPDDTVDPNAEDDTGDKPPEKKPQPRKKVRANV